MSVEDAHSPSLELSQQHSNETKEHSLMSFLVTRNFLHLASFVLALHFPQLGRDVLLHGKRFFSAESNKNFNFTSCTSSRWCEYSQLGASHTRRLVSNGINFEERAECGVE